MYNISCCGMIAVMREVAALKRQVIYAERMSSLDTDDKSLYKQQSAPG